MDSATLASFYEAAYSAKDANAALYARWRSLSAVGKADHVIVLCRRAAIAPANTLEVGCGDGALLCELARRGFGGELHGAEIAPAAVQIAASRPELQSVALYDGNHLPFKDGTFELGILSHVLEHVPEPAVLLAEVARVCRSVVVEVPLEANLSARRHSKQQHAREIGHLQRLGRPHMRDIVRRSGLQIAAELQDPLPWAVHSFFAERASHRVRAGLKWAVRSAVHRLSPALARRLFSVHYACLCRPAG